MLLILFLLALGAILRGWFPWSLIIFALPYVAVVVDQNALSTVPGMALFGIASHVGGVVEWCSGGVLCLMIFWPRL